MEWSAVSSFIKPESLIVVAACWAVGYALKRTPRVPDWGIIYVVTMVAVIMVCFLTGFNAESILQGILCGAVAVYGNQLVKQTKKGTEEQEG